MWFLVMSAAPVWSGIGLFCGGLWIEQQLAGAALVILPEQGSRCELADGAGFVQPVAGFERQDIALRVLYQGAEAVALADDADQRPIPLRRSWCAIGRVGCGCSAAGRLSAGPVGGEVGR